MKVPHVFLDDNDKKEYYKIIDKAINEMPISLYSNSKLIFDWVDDNWLIIMDGLETLKDKYGENP